VREQFNERSIYDNYLREIDKDKDIIWKKDRKNQVRSKLILNINKFERKTKMQTGLKYVSNFGVFIVLLIFGYQFFLSNITYNEEVLTEPTGNQTQNFLVVDDSDESDNENSSDSITKKNELKEINSMDLRLPTYIPEQVNTESQYLKRSYLGETGPIEVTYLDSKSYFFSFAQSEIAMSKEATIEQIKNEMYKNDVLEEFEIAGHPSFLLLEDGDTSYYSSLHIITNKYFITLTTHGIEKEEIIKIANSIDLTGL
jgi:hypothetical protein